MDEQLNEQPENLADNLDMVNYIMLHRIYDLLTIIANKLVGTDEVEKMLAYHDKGYLLTPGPSYTPQENQEK
jgi:hypothetical protein